MRRGSGQQSRPRLQRVFYALGRRDLGKHGGGYENARLLFSIGSLVGAVVFALEGHISAVIALVTVGGALLLQWIARRELGAALGSAVRGPAVAGVLVGSVALAFGAMAVAAGTGWIRGGEGLAALAGLSALLFGRISLKTLRRLRRPDRSAGDL